MLRKNEIKNKNLKYLAFGGKPHKLNQEWIRRITRILSIMNIMCDPAELDLPGYKFHELRYDRKGTFSVLVSGNWRITFKWEDEGPFDIDLEDYHE